MARVLIVDDNLLIRTLLREILAKAGHEVVGEARDGLHTPERVRELHPDVVTLDLVMPGRDGLATLTHLLMIDPSLTVVVCSASLDERRVIKALRLGAKGFIVKPFDRGTVLTAVQKALGAPPGDPPWPLEEPPLLRFDTVDWEGEQREFGRVSAALRVLVQPGDGAASFDTVTVDLSGGGMLLACGRLVRDTRLSFHLELDPDQPPVRGRARVARVTSDEQPAVTFEAMTIADHERLLAYVRGRHRSPSASATPAGVGGWAVSAVPRQPGWV